MACRHSTPAKKLAASRAWKRRNKARVKAYRARYFLTRKAEEYATHRAWIAAHPERWKALQRRDRQRNGAARGRRRRPVTTMEQRARYHRDLRYAIEKRLRAAIHQAVHRVKVSKAASLRVLLGCSVDELRRHLEAQFRPGMTMRTIHIDHIRACANFDLTQRSEQLACFHFTNLQPLWPAENIRKSNR